MQQFDGGSGRDTIYGGPGNDNIFGDDHTFDRSGHADVIYGRDSDDRLEVANRPRSEARKDIVYCGTGIDKVIADSADQVARDCENVKRV